MSRNRGHVKWCLLRMLKCRLCVTNSMHCRSSINSSTHRNYSSVAYTPITVYRCRAAEQRNQIVRTSFEKIAFLNYNRHCLIMWRVSGLKFTVHLWSERVGGGGGRKGELSMYKMCRKLTDWNKCHFQWQPSYKYTVLFIYLFLHYFDLGFPPAAHARMTEQSH